MPGDPNIPIAAKVTMFGDNWYWYGSGNMIFTWRPGQNFRVAGTIGSDDRIFALGNQVYLSNQSNGAFHLLKRQ